VVILGGVLHRGAAQAGRQAGRVEKLILVGSQRMKRQIRTPGSVHMGNDPATMRWYPLAHSCSASI
jgi:hypothetical protein